MKSKVFASVFVAACVTACAPKLLPISPPDFSAATLFRDRLPVRPLPLPPGKLAAFKAAAADAMKDPQSVQFRKLRGVKDAKEHEGLCGEMNAKNSYGGYTGFKSFYAIMLNGKAGVSTSDELLGDMVVLMCGS